MEPLRVGLIPRLNPAVGTTREGNATGIQLTPTTGS